jgi:hypothetical protein
LRAIVPDGGGKRIGNSVRGHITALMPRVGFLTKTRSGLSNPDRLACRMIGTGRRRS